MAEVVRELLPVMLALFVLDGLTFVRPSQFLLVDRTGSGFRRLDPGLRVAGLLPWELVLASNRLILGWTSAGVHWLRRPDSVGAVRLDPESWGFLPWEAVRGLSTEDRKLRLSGGDSDQPAVVSLASASAARFWHRRISTLRDLPPEERGPALAEAAFAASDLDALSARHRWLRPALQRLGALSLLLGGGVFLLLPAASIAGASPRILGVVLVYCLAVHGFLGADAVRLRRAMRAQGGRLAISHLLTVLLYPPSALHAAGVLSPDCHAEFDGLALVAVFQDPAELVREARHELSSVRHALAQEGPEGWQELWTRRRLLVGRVLEQCGVDEDEVLQPPARRDPEAALFCGLCDAEYLAGTQRCSQCDIPLESLTRRDTQERPEPGVLAGRR